MYQTRKIGVVGQGHVGAHVANSLLMQGIADELYLCDINEAKVTSEVQDLRDSLSFVPYNTKIVNCYDHYEELACCDVIASPISPGSSCPWVLPALLASTMAVRSAQRHPISLPLTPRALVTPLSQASHMPSLLAQTTKPCCVPPTPAVSSTLWIL